MAKTNKEPTMNAVKSRQPALTIFQPYAWLIVAGFKPIENRGWSTTYRGPLIIHAGAKMHDHPIHEIERRYRVKIDPRLLRLGGVIGEVDLVDVVTQHPSPWFTGPFGFVLQNPRPLPFRYLRGGQGIFEAFHQ